ncbi:MAG: hypothetical protein HYW71_02575 [Candidatus Niyogibacteria bacterium]|nr:hypothetical protein [Candidatus Niyogibacteria bacterium]
MKSYTEQELEKKYKQLPATVEEVIFSANAAKTLEEIRKKYKLQIDQLGILANETRLVMLGLTHPKDFINNLAEGLELNKEIAKNIAQEINQRIFYKIREELKKMHSIGEPADFSPKAGSPLPPKAGQPSAGAKKFRIQDLKKTAELPPIIEPTPLEPPPTEPPPLIAEKPKIPAVPFEHKLKSEETIRQPLEKIKTSPDKKYPGEDPYREPII